MSYQIKSSEHRAICNGVSASTQGFDTGSPTAMHNTSITTALGGVSGIQIVLDRISGTNVLCSYIFNADDRIEGSLGLVAISYVAESPRTRVYLSAGTFCPVNEKTGTFLVPLLDLELGEQQYVAIGFPNTVDETGVDFEAQLTVYTKEYPFFQPLK